jgi:hypothetical protein
MGLAIIGYEAFSDDTLARAVIANPRTVNASAPRQQALVDLTTRVTAEPWTLVAYQAQAVDAAMFDAVATATTAGVFSRITVALAPLAA